MELKTKISVKYTLNDLVKSQTATQCNFTEQFTPSDEVVANLKELSINILDKIPFTIVLSSVYRCKRLNTQIKGSKTSDHMDGMSVDIDTLNDANNGEIFEWIKKNLEFDQLIWEHGDNADPDWVHVSYRKNNNRNQILKAIKKDGKTVYLPLGK